MLSRCYLLCCCRYLWCSCRYLWSDWCYLWSGCRYLWCNKSPIVRDKSPALWDYAGNFVCRVTPSRLLSHCHTCCHTINDWYVVCCTAVTVWRQKNNFLVYSCARANVLKMYLNYNVTTVFQNPSSQSNQRRKRRSVADTLNCYTMGNSVMFSYGQKSTKNLSKMAIRGLFLKISGCS